MTHLKAIESTPLPGAWYDLTVRIEELIATQMKL